jgi:hypothetical protein
VLTDSKLGGHSQVAYMVGGAMSKTPDALLRV